MRTNCLYNSGRMIWKNFQHVQKPPTQTFFMYIFESHAHCTRKAPTHLQSYIQPRPKWTFFPPLRAQSSCSIIAFPHNDAILTEINHCFVWYRCIACWGAIKFLIKTNCLSLTSIEFFLQLSDKNKYVLLENPLPLLPFSSLGVSCECVCKLCNLKICLSCYMTRKHLSWYLPPLLARFFFPPPKLEAKVCRSAP